MQLPLLEPPISGPGLALDGGPARHRKRRGPTPGQLSFLEKLLRLAPPKRRDRVVSHLAQPFDREESRVVNGFYRENVRLVRCFIGRLRKKYGGCMDPVDVESCVGVAFLKAWRAWKVEKGEFSTVFWVYAQGECQHWIKANNFAVKAPQRVRARGAKARRLLEMGFSTAHVLEEVGCSMEQLEDALKATAGLAHEQKDWEMHASHQMTPWEVLEAETGAVW